MRWFIPKIKEILMLHFCYLIDTAIFLVLFNDGRLWAMVNHDSIQNFSLWFIRWRSADIHAHIPTYVHLCGCKLIDYDETHWFMPEFFDSLWVFHFETNFFFTRSAGCRPFNGHTMGIPLTNTHTSTGPSEFWTMWISSVQHFCSFVQTSKFAEQTTMANTIWTGRPTDQPTERDRPYKHTGNTNSRHEIFHNKTKRTA